MDVSLLRGILFAALVVISVRPSNGKELVRLEYDPLDGLILVPVKVFNQVCWFALDTGSTGSFIDTSLREKLGPVVGTVTVNRESEVDIHAAPAMEIGDLVLRSDWPVACQDQSEFIFPNGKRIHGIIGMDLLRRFILQVDPDHSTVSFIDADTVPKSDWGTELAITIDKTQRPRITGHVNSAAPITFLIDLGLEDTFDLSVAESQKLVAVNRDALTSIGATSRSGLARTDGWDAVLRAKAFVLGPFAHSDLAFVRSDGCRLGFHYFRRFKATFDFPRRKLYLKPSKHFFEYDYSHDGLLFDSELVDGRGYKLGVFEGSPAAKVGIHYYDLLLEVDGQAVGEMDVKKLTRYFQLAASQDVSLVIERDGQRMQFTLPRGKRVGSIVPKKERK